VTLGRAVIVKIPLVKSQGSGGENAEDNSKGPHSSNEGLCRGRGIDRRGAVSTLEEKSLGLKYHRLWVKGR